jgi:hypothetical protein
MIGPEQYTMLLLFIMAIRHSDVEPLPDDWVGSDVMPLFSDTVGVGYGSM